MTAPEGTYIRIAESMFEPGRVHGSRETEQLDASWDLSFDSDEEALLHLPRDWMYRAPVPQDEAAVAVSGRALRRGRCAPASARSQWTGGAA